MSNVRRTIAIAAACLTLTALVGGSGTQASAIARDARWRPLFDGKTLEGWLPKIKGYPIGDNFGNSFSVGNGTIRVGYDGYGGVYADRPGFLVTKESFGAFHLRLQYRMVPGAGLPDAQEALRSNSGVLYFVQSPDTLKPAQGMPVGLELQLLGDVGEGPRPTGSICIPKGVFARVFTTRMTNHCIFSTGPTIPNGQWTKVDLIVRPDGSSEHRINGRTVMRVVDPQRDPLDPYAAPLVQKDGVQLRKGHIALQSEGHGIEFKNIEIKPYD
ncbi:3-keto-disaccharide hydrolase [Sphingobium algorifonticola]|uniref:3-keto-disaccharide hydrolase n=1 Tax=Sphingobium algorifonticola TaxID=2008318 RepID=UPI0013E35B7A|nr:DUF1080 domain-containing protein [Sphingobium algorifonticola]